MTETETTTPKIYVACLASYNEGRLHGIWIDATEGSEAVWGAINAMLAASKALNPEEIAIHDYEGFGGYQVGEYESIDRVIELAEAIEEHGEPFTAYLALGIEGRDATIEEIVEGFEEAYCGEQTLKDYAEENARELIGAGLTQEQWESIENYIDTEYLERELSHDYSEVTEQSYSTYLFRTV